MKTAHYSIVEPLLNTLRSLHLEVQHEGKLTRYFLNLILKFLCIL